MHKHSCQNRKIFRGERKSSGWPEEISIAWCIFCGTFWKVRRNAAENMRFLVCMYCTHVSTCSGRVGQVEKLGRIRVSLRTPRRWICMWICKDCRWIWLGCKDSSVQGSQVSMISLPTGFRTGEWVGVTTGTVQRAHPAATQIQFPNPFSGHVALLLG
jgi:hypothetical protein